MKPARAAPWVAALLLLAVAEVRAAEPPRLLLIHSFAHAHSPWSDIAGSLRTELARRWTKPLDLYEVSLDTARIREPAKEDLFVEYLRALFQGRSLDLIVPIGAPAAHFVARQRSELFPDTPMLVVGADERRIPAGTLGPDDAFVPVPSDPPMMEHILRLRPATRKVAVAIGSSPVERYWKSQLQRDLLPFAERLEFTWFDALTLEEMRRHVATLPPDSVLFYYLVSEDAAGVSYPEDSALDPLVAASPVPVFGLGDYQLGRGIVGGPLLPTRAVGRRAATTAIRILSGGAAGAGEAEPVVIGPPVYDWRELRRWGIAESLLPPGSLVRFREPSVWEQYRWPISAIALVLVTQTLLIAGLLHQRRRRRHAEGEARERLWELKHLNRRASAGELSASIAHEIKQPIAAMVANADAGLLWLEREGPDLKEVDAALRQIVRDGHRAGAVVEVVQNLFRREPREEEVCDLGELVQAVLELLHAELQKHSVWVRRELEPRPMPVRVDRIQLQQVVLNLVMNALEAMRSQDEPRVLRVRSERIAPDEVALHVEDSGPGADLEHLERMFLPFFTTKAMGMGMGLSISRSIVEAHGGRLEVAPLPGRGLGFCIVLPRAAGP